MTLFSLDQELFEGRTNLSFKHPSPLIIPQQGTENASGAQIFPGEASLISCPGVRIGDQEVECIQVTQSTACTAQKGGPGEF